MPRDTTAPSSHAASSDARHPLARPTTSAASKRASTACRPIPSTRPGAGAASRRASLPPRALRRRSCSWCGSCTSWIAQPRPDIVPGPLDVARGARRRVGERAPAGGRDHEPRARRHRLPHRHRRRHADRPAARRGAAAAPRRRPDHLGPAGAAVGRVGARRDHLVRPVGRHRLLRDPDGRDPVDRQRAHRRRRPGAAAAAARRHRARRRRAGSSRPP